jgi:hypothetical protein
VRLFSSLEIVIKVLKQLNDNLGSGTPEISLIPTTAVRKELVADVPPWRAGFAPKSDHGGFVVDKVALRQFSSEHFSYLPILIPTTAPCSSKL